MKNASQKISYILSFLLMFSFGYSQEPPCNGDIIKTGSELTGNYLYLSKPVLSNQRIVLSKIVSSESNAYGIMISSVHSFLDVERHGLYIKFEDGFILKKPNVESKPEVYSNSEWKYISVLIIKNDDLLKFSTKRIVKVNAGFDDFEVDEVSGNQLLYYMNCLQKIK